VTDPEIKFGYAVTGTVHPDRIKTNAGARPGDTLILTKKIGTGVIATALKRGIASEDHVAKSIQSMLTLNRAACKAMDGLEVHAVTDVTGFGLLGHAREMAMASEVTLEIDASSVQFLDGAVEYANAGAIPGGLNNNREFVSDCVAGSPADLLYDPQTSGGLLISMPEPGEYLKRCPSAYILGQVLERSGKPIRV
jgi:selenide, water dikinase